MRRRRIAGALDKFLSYQSYALLDDGQTNIKLKKFAEGADLHVEVGSGRGGFLCQMAQLYPDKKFVGIELKEELLISAVEKAAVAELDNLIFVRGYAENFQKWFEDIAIQTLYLNFVDPWPRRRNARKRLTHSNYLKLYKSRMKRNAELIFKTDNRYLYLFSIVELAKFFKVVSSTHNLYAVGDPANVATEYEKRYVAQGKNIYRIICNNEE
ncbi:MAG: tRNA (guanosine(46)-N7)-methyltransferase TrmB [Clostridiales bacterium]|nr:MAG: tRNA (guanosine(46)-N7)-methyltransferase TrmB [Clostridiales bacterium]